MADFIITNTAKYNQSETKTGVIDGVEYTVRNVGAGDQLTFISSQRKIKKLKAAFDATNDDEERAELAGKLADLTLDFESMLVGLFDDGTKDRKHAQKLVRKIGVDGTARLIGDIFNPKED